MLEFVDLPKIVRINRIESTMGRRPKKSHLGNLLKSALTIDERLSAALTAEEREEVESLLGLYRDVDRAQQKLYALRFPEIMRQVIEYYRSNEATEIEKKMIQVAVDRAGVLLRRAKHEEDEDVSTQ